MSPESLQTLSNFLGLRPELCQDLLAAFDIFAFPAHLFQTTTTFPEGALHCRGIQTFFESDTLNRVPIN
jgi:hypothetical protein